MALVWMHSYLRWSPRSEALAGSAVREFAAVSLILATGLIFVTAEMPGAGLQSIIAALFTFAVAATVAGRALHRTYPHDRLGLCNALTLSRLALTIALLASLVAGAGASWAIFAAAIIALTLDGLDGWLARRQRLVSDFGARFDLEVDSALALVLAYGAAMTSGVGAIAIVLGLPRYLFAAASWRVPWMRRDLPERFSRKVVCVAQLGVLIALQAPFLHEIAAVALVPMVVLALAWSFAVDILWLWQRRARPGP